MLGQTKNWVFPLLFFIVIVLLLSQPYLGKQTQQILPGQYVSVPCYNYDQCITMFKDAGLTDQQINSLGLKCEKNKCYIKGGAVTGKVKK